MQPQFFEQLRRSISDDRFRPYLSRGVDAHDPICFAYYVWNTALGESLYPALQGLEISLRNSIHDAATQGLSNNYWFDNLLIARERGKSERVKSDLIRDRKSLSPETIVARSSLGFWISLFDAPYEQVLWPRYSGKFFPTSPGRFALARIF